MTAWVALIRAVNVGGRLLKMSSLKAIADQLKLANARTYIASGNLLFTSDKRESVLKVALEKALGRHMGHPVDVILRTAEEMVRAVEANPFGSCPGNRVVAIFIDDAPVRDTLAQAKNITDEEVALGDREIYVHYPSGMGRSKLRIPAAKSGTARNMNTAAKLAQLAKEMA